jgi:TolB-like protein
MDEKVYQAEDLRLRRTVALKFLPPELVSDPETKARFLQEARAASSLDHPNICTIHEIDETADGRIFIAMACYEGETLAERLGRGPLPPDEAVDVAMQVARGLDRAHERGIVHRDIKPANIFIPADGPVKILDFGLAKLAGGTRITRTGTMLGTVRYMSPEQIRGEDADRRSDIWSLGVVLHEMLTGGAPFAGEREHAVIYAILNEDPTPVRTARPGTPVGLARVVDRALAKHPDERYRTAAELIRALESLRGRIAGGRIAAEGRDARPRPSIAVLPFANMSPDPENAYFGDGLAEELINALAQIRGLRVASRTSSFRFRGGDVDVREIGERLNVAHVLEGSVRRAGDRLRVTAQLVDVPDGYHLWSRRFDREMQDIFRIQDDIACAIVEQLEVQLVGAGERTLVTCGTDNLEAYTAFLEGRYHLHSLTPEGWAASLPLLEKAAALDPGFALPHAWLADYYQSLGWWGNARPQETIPRSRAAALRAIELDESLGFAHYALAIILFFYDWDPAGAEREFQRGLELDPVSGWGRMCLAIYLSCRGRRRETIEAADLALKLEPLDGLLAAWVASALICVGETAEAIDVIQRAIAIDQEHWQSQLFLGFAHLHESRPEAAARALERAVELSGGASITLAVLGVVRHLLERTDGADAIEADLGERAHREYVSPCFFAHLALARGERSVAAAHLERAVGERDLFVVTQNMWPSRIRLQGPPFDAILERAGVP